MDDPGGIHETGPFHETVGSALLDVGRVWQEAGGRVDSACTLAWFGIVPGVVTVTPLIRLRLAGMDGPP
jgi:hypothetical protein